LFLEASAPSRGYYHNIKSNFGAHCKVKKQTNHFVKLTFTPITIPAIPPMRTQTKSFPDDKAGEYDASKMLKNNEQNSV